MLQLTGVPHIPLLPHVWTAVLPEHCVAPGVQVPVQMPAEQTPVVQATGELQVPVELHVSTALVEPPSAPGAHWTDPGAHEPVQAPATHAWFVHPVMVALQLPVLSHVW